jgi:hypothetical protein
MKTKTTEPPEGGTPNGPGEEAEPSIFAQANEGLGQLTRRLRDGDEIKLGRAGITLPHYPTSDTALAACLVTLAIPLREPAPFVDSVKLTESGNDAGRTKLWWFGDVSADGHTYHDEKGQEKPHRTEEMMAAWADRATFEAQYPMHPLVPMRAALDARAWWVDVIHGGQPLPRETRKTSYRTDSIHAASILKASGFAPYCFSGHAFHLQATHGQVHAEQILVEAAKLAGASPPRWMASALFNYSQMVKHAKNQSLIVQQQTGPGQSVLLTEDATTQTKRKFFKLI